MAEALSNVPNSEELTVRRRANIVGGDGVSLGTVDEEFSLLEANSKTEIRNKFIEGARLEMDTDSKFLVANPLVDGVYADGVRARQELLTQTEDSPVAEDNEPGLEETLSGAPDEEAAVGMVGLLVAIYGESYLAGVENEINNALQVEDDDYVIQSEFEAAGVENEIQDYYTEHAEGNDTESVDITAEEEVRFALVVQGLGELALLDDLPFDDEGFDSTEPASFTDEDFQGIENFANGEVEYKSRNTEDEISIYGSELIVAAQVELSELSAENEQHALIIQGLGELALQDELIIEHDDTEVIDLIELSERDHDDLDALEADLVMPDDIAEATPDSYAIEGEMQLNQDVLIS
jgi:hypothetical protein